MLKELFKALHWVRAAPNIFLGHWVEATSFGSKKIIDQFQEEGVRIDGVIAHWWGCPKNRNSDAKFKRDVLIFDQDH